MSPLSLRNAVVVTRIIAGLLAGVSLALFAIVIDKVFNFEFSVAVKPWISTLPAFALGVAILWNIVAMMTRLRVKFYVHVVGDLIVVSILAVLGAIGFAHDNEQYLRNGLWTYFDSNDNSDWLRVEISAASVLLASCILQLLLPFLSWFQYRKDRKEFHKQCKVCGCENGAILERMETGVVKIGEVEDRKSFGTLTISSDIDVEEKRVRE